MFCGRGLAPDFGASRLEGLSQGQAPSHSVILTPSSCVVQRTIAGSTNYWILRLHCVSRRMTENTALRQNDKGANPGVATAAWRSQATPSPAARCYIRQAEAGAKPCPRDEACFGAGTRALRSASACRRHRSQKQPHSQKTQTATGRNSRSHTTHNWLSLLAGASLYSKRNIVLSAAASP